MRQFSLFLVSAILCAQSPTGTVELSDARRASAERLRQQGEAITDRFEALTFTGKDGRAMPYRLFRPGILDAGRTYPLVVFLHGSGGLGIDNRKQFTGGNLVGSRVWALDANQARQPVFVALSENSTGTRISGGFLEGDEFGLGRGHALGLQQQVAEILVSAAPA